MKRQIRRGTFETNSSSTHSLTFMMADDYDRWKNENLYLCTSTFGYEFTKPKLDKLYTKEEVKYYIGFNKYYHGEEINFEDKSLLYGEYGFRSFDYEDDVLESYSYEYETPLGEKVIAFGEYGHD